MVFKVKIFLRTNFFNIPRPKFGNIFKRKFVDFACEWYVYWESYDILGKKICLKTWFSLKIFIKSINFSCLSFFPKNCPNNPNLYTTVVLEFYFKKRGFNIEKNVCIFQSTDLHKHTSANSRKLLFINTDYISLVYKKEKIRMYY